MFTHKTPRVVAARRLTTRSGRGAAGRFLAEGAHAVTEALRRPERVHELFVTEQAASRHAELLRDAAGAGVTVSGITERAADLLSETVTPQGIVAVCDTIDVPLERLFAGTPALVAVLVGISDPGNAGTVLRVADAAGADGIVFAGDTVDPHNGKCLRASTGSLFHLPVARVKDVADVFAACRAAGLRVVAADGNAELDLTGSDTLGDPIAWVFGSEAHGLDAPVLADVDEVLKVPLYGAAESLNLATAAAVCLYASAMRRARQGR